MESAEAMSGTVDGAALDLSPRIWLLVGTVPSVTVQAVSVDFCHNMACPDAVEQLAASSLPPTWEDTLAYNFIVADVTVLVESDLAGSDALELLAGDHFPSLG